MLIDQRRQSQELLQTFIVGDTCKLHKLQNAIIETVVIWNRNNSIVTTDFFLDVGKTKMPSHALKDISR